MPATPHKASQKYARLKQKLAQKQQRIKGLSTKNTQLARSRQHWRSKYFQLKHSQQPQRVKHHPYCLQLMLLGVVLHIHHNLSLRACSAVLYEVTQRYGQTIRRISAATIRDWSRRLGHYYLQVQLQAGSYVLLVDESILIGHQKLLVLLAVPQHQQCRIAPLTMADGLVIHVQAASRWPGADIARVIAQKSRQPGVRFAYAVSDKASNLRKAFRLCELPWLEDVTHWLAGQIRLLLQQDACFEDFMAQQQLTRAKWVLSGYAAYLPPNQRRKARFHQLLRSVAWAQRVLAHWPHLPQPVQAELHYVFQHQALIMELGQVQQLVESFSKLVKAKGISRHSQCCWQESRQAQQAYWQQQGWVVSERLAVLVSKMDSYLAQRLPKVEPDEPLVCCTDVLESMFGKYKYGVGQQVISDESVKIAAYGRCIGLVEVSAAMASITHEYLREQQAKQPPSLTKERRAALPKITS